MQPLASGFAHALSGGSKPAYVTHALPVRRRSYVSRSATALGILCFDAIVFTTIYVVVGE